MFLKNIIKQTMQSRPKIHKVLDKVLEKSKEGLNKIKNEINKESQALTVLVVLWTVMMVLYNCKPTWYWVVKLGEQLVKSAKKPMVTYQQLVLYIP